MSNVWVTIVVVLVIESLVAGAVGLMPINTDVKRWLGVATLLATAVFFGWKFLV